MHSGIPARPAMVSNNEQQLKTRGGSIMLRAFSAFLVVFSILGLVVHLNALGDVFGMAALSLFVIDELVVQFAKTPRHSRMRGEPVR
jgi:uncharacterized membrane protein